MHILSIYDSQENTVLRQTSRLVVDDDFHNGYVQTVVSALQEALEYYGNGVGLSAVQLGELVQIFMINCRPTEAFPHMQEFKAIIINPVITVYGDETFDGWEGCLSIADDKCVPTHRYKIRRSTHIVFDYTDEQGVRHTQVGLSGFAAVVFQHEYDHCFGRLIDESSIDGVSAISNEEYMQRKDTGEQMTL